MITAPAVKGMAKGKACRRNTTSWIQWSNSIAVNIDSNRRTINNGGNSKLLVNISGNRHPRTSGRDDAGAKPIICLLDLNDITSGARSSFIKG